MRFDLKSRISLINFRKSQEKINKNQFDDDIEENPHFETADNFSPGPKRKFIQKKKKKTKRKNHSISSQNSFRRNKTISIRSAVSSLDSVNSYDSDDQYTSEEDNPNDRSGLLSFATGIKGKPKHSKTKPKLKNKNQWVDSKEKQDTKSRRKKLFRSSANLSLVLPRIKNRMKRSKLIRKKKRPDNIILSNGSPYEEYLPARFRDYKGEELNSSKIHFQNKARENIELPSAYIVSPSVPISSKPPKSVQSSNKELNFYNKKSGKTKQRSNIDHVEEINSANFGLSPRMEHLNEENEDSLSNNQDLNLIDHKNVLFQRNHKVKPHPEDRSQKPLKDILFSMNADFHRNNEKNDIFSV